MKAKGGAAVIAMVIPGAASDNSVTSGLRRNHRTLIDRALEVILEPLIFTPFKDISRDINEAKGVVFVFVFPRGMRLKAVEGVASIPTVAGVHVVAPKVGAVGAGATSVFPLGFTGEAQLVSGPSQP